MHTFPACVLWKLVYLSSPEWRKFFYTSTAVQYNFLYLNRVCNDILLLQISMGNVVLFHQVNLFNSYSYSTRFYRNSLDDDIRLFKIKPAIPNLLDLRQKVKFLTFQMSMSFRKETFSSLNFSDGFI